MNLFKNLFGKKAEPARNWLPLKVRCRRCGEIIEARVDMSNDLSVDYDEAGQATYHCRSAAANSSKTKHPHKDASYQTQAS